MTYRQAWRIIRAANRFITPAYGGQSIARFRWKVKSDVKATSAGRNATLDPSHTVRSFGSLTRAWTARRWAGVALMILALCGAAVLVGARLGWWALPELLPQRIPHTDLNPYGANFFLDREVEPWKQEKTLEMAQAAGIGWVKQQFSWEEIEPKQKGVFDWAKYDRIVDLADRYGMQIIARLDRPPDWSRTDNQFKTRPPDNLADFGDFVYAFVQRYGGRVRYIQIWNEPNLSSEWGYQRVDAVAYARLLQVAYQRAKEADPDVVVLSAPLAITLEDASMRGNHNDLVFLEQMYEAGAGAYFDILSANAFGLDRPPEDPPAPHVLNFRRVELQRAIMERYGDAGKPIWINEYGWNAAPPSIPKELLTWERVTEAEQAVYTSRGIAWARQHWPWLGVVNIWYFRQVGDVPADRPAYYFAMVDLEFNEQPVYDAVRRAATEAALRSGKQPMADRVFYLLTGLCALGFVAGALIYRAADGRKQDQ